MSTLALVAVVAWFEPAAEAATKPLYKGTFKAELRGSYQVDWRKDFYLSGESGNGGSQDCEGSGVERVTFATPAPLKVKMTMGGPSSPPRFTFASTGDSTMHLASTLERTATMVHSGGCPELQSCGAGTQLDWWLELESDKEFAGPGRTYITLTAYKPRQIAEPLPQCVLPAEVSENFKFPDLWNRDDDYRVIAAFVHGFKFFKPDVKRFEYPVSGFSDNFDSDGVGSRTALDFTLGLKRTSR